MLENMVVLEIAEGFMGPLAGLLLSDFGATVIKIEPPEWKRSLESRFARRDRNIFLPHNRGKKSLVLDLALPQGMIIFRELVNKSDVVLSSYPPSVVKKLGLDYETLGRINERIICANVCGYGLKGKDVERRAYDLAIQADSGIMSVTGEAGRIPVPCGVPISDERTGILAVLGILAARIALEKEGRGRQVDVAMFDAMLLSFGHYAINYYERGELPGQLGVYATTLKRAEYRVYATKDGHIVSATGKGEDSWQAFCRVMGRPELGTDLRYDAFDKRCRDDVRAEMEALFMPIFKTRTTDEWMKLFSEADLPCAPVNTLDKVLRKAEEQGRGMIVNFEKPLGGKATGIGNPVKVGTKEYINLDPPPRFGEHTKEILNSILNYNEGLISKLAGDRVIFLGS